MDILKRISWVLIIAIASALTLTNARAASDFYIYSIYKSIDLGEPGEKPQKDFYVNMGTAQGVKPGSVLEVLRRVTTNDQTNQKAYKDLTFQIATLKVIHAEGNAAIARLEAMVPGDQMPALSARGVMVGDLVRAH